MKSLSQKIYWKLPCVLKNIAASLNARKLDRQRYNKYFYELIQKIILLRSKEDGGST